MNPQAGDRAVTNAQMGGGTYDPRDSQQQDTPTISPTNQPVREGSKLPRQRKDDPTEEQDNQATRNTTLSPVGERKGQDLDSSVDLSIREKPRTNGGAGTKTATSRKCKKCGESLTGQFVRALGGTFHLDCFKCRDCGEVVASKFFPVDDEDGEGQYPLCETDYFRRLDLLCFNCGGALRGSYVTALDRKYHIDHFTCSVCPTAFGAKDSYYEHEGRVYCHYHYSTRFAQRCNGCRTAILKQFVEIFRNGQNQHWHPECYMIHKFWNVRLAASGTDPTDESESEEDATEQKRVQVREEEEQMEDRVYRIWSVLSTFEESSAACISDMLLHVSNGAYVDGILVAKKFIAHVDILFSATDVLDGYVTSQGFKGLAYGREAKLLCKKIVAFFSLLSKTQEIGVKRLGVTQELLSLVTGLAHYLKLLIRISLQGALKLERETHTTNGLHSFLDDLSHLDSIKDSDTNLDVSTSDAILADESSDTCVQCRQPIDDECYKTGIRRWHVQHLRCDHCQREIGQDNEYGIEGALWCEEEQRVFCPRCSDMPESPVQGFEHISRLHQYVFLLRVALARLLSVLRSGGTLPHTSDDPNLTTYDSSEGHRITPGDQSRSLLMSPTRSKSYGGTSAEDQASSSYEQTVGEMKRLRSTRMDKHLSTTIKKARTSRIIDGPEGQSIGANGVDAKGNSFHIVEDREREGEPATDLTFGNQNALTLDDIPRIVAAEQAKEQRPNAYKHARNQLMSPGQQPKLINGHQRDVLSSGQENDRAGTGDFPPQRTKRYFSELSALEYFIVRHIAVLSMQPLLEGHFNLEDLLSLIESRKPTFWGKFGRAFKNDKAKVGKKKGVFGVGLDILVERDGVDSTDGVGPGALRVPCVLDDTVSAMRKMDMSVEGVFRKNGNIRGLKDLAERIDAKEGEVDLDRESPVQVAALLKRFLRELPDPLLTFKLHDLFTTSQKITDEEKRRRVLHLTCCLLPKSHRDSVEILFSFLNWAASFSQVDEDSGSKMDTHNLATVITPNILKHADYNTKGPGMDESFLAIEAVHMLIDYNDQMCEVPEDIQSILNDSSLFNNSSEITTKEILKRYGDVGKSTKVHLIADSENAELPLPQKESNGNARANAPVVTRVDKDPHQAKAWQKESSVRHVQGNGGPAFSSAPNYQNTHPQDTPPQVHFEFTSPNNSYHQRAGSNESATSFTVSGRNPQRQSGWGKPGVLGPMGITGAG